MSIYHLTKKELINYGMPGVPYLPFDRFNNIVRDYRDDLYAVENIPGFAMDIFNVYALWTARADNRYLNNILFDQLTDPVFISLNTIASKDKPTFDLEVLIYDEKKEYFRHHQTLAVQRKNKRGEFVTTSCWKVDSIREFLEMQALTKHCS